MHRRSLLMLAVTSAAVLAGGLLPAAAEQASRLSGPQSHANLTIYFVHGPSAAGPVPLTLQEAVAARSVQVYETGSVNELQIENLSDREVFVQSGDIVKGGKQDRVLMVSLVLPPRSGRLSIASFCVEQGRWSARGQEDASRFASADRSLPSRSAKLAMKAPMRANAQAPSGRSALPQGDVALPTGGLGVQRPGMGEPFAGRTRGERRSARSETSERQQAVWNTVATVQQKLSGNVGQSVAAPQSASSLQLSLENAKLRERHETYRAALQAAGEATGDIIGFVFAVNGKINSGDVYPSNALFRKMWPKLLDASIIEAIGDHGEAGAAGAPPTEAEVLAFLKGAEGGEAQQRDLLQTVRLETREAAQALYFSTERSGGGFVHRNYLAK